MSQSLSKLFVHIIFHIKNPKLPIRKTDKHDLYAVMGTIIKNNDSIPVLINGTGDHVHILCVMSKNISLAKLIEEVKRNSSRWIKTHDRYYRNFAWQGGYAGFSVSSSIHGQTKHYIKNQEEHHKKRSFRDELKLFLELHGVAYNKKYI